jgi:hypothetical protein
MNAIAQFVRTTIVGGLLFRAPIVVLIVAKAFDYAKKGRVEVKLGESGRAHFGATHSPSRVARLAIERHGDLIEAYLLDRATRWDPP